MELVGATRSCVTSATAPSPGLVLTPHTRRLLLLQDPNAGPETTVATGAPLLGAHALARDGVPDALAERTVALRDVEAEVSAGVRAVAQRSSLCTNGYVRAAALVDAVLGYFRASAFRLPTQGKHLYSRLRWERRPPSDDSRRQQLLPRRPVPRQR